MVGRGIAERGVSVAEEQTMRVIAGLAKGRQLKVPKATTTRPMTELVKGALFSMLQPYGLDDRRVLDLYAGSGSIGIEALSRGAPAADFVEQNTAVCAVLSANLTLTRFEERTRVYTTRVTAFLSRLAGAPPPAERRYGLVVMDPPYAAPDIVQVLETVAASPALATEALIVVGHSVRVALPDRAGRYVRAQHRCHGDSCFSIYAALVEDGAAAEGSAEEEGDRA